MVSSRFFLDDVFGSRDDLCVNDRVIIKIILVCYTVKWRLYLVMTVFEHFATRTSRSCLKYMALTLSLQDIRV